jgi:soluble lytic murein transglycosylase
MGSHWPRRSRQESGFNAKAVSSAHALGLMQVTPEAAHCIAKKFNVAYDQSRLPNDTVYNMQIGAAGLADDIGRYNGSYVLAFAGYNAGRGRVKEWIERYGDPRDPKVDPIDWVERIVSQDPQLRPTHHREHTGLSCAARRRQTPAD